MEYVQQLNAYEDSLLTLFHKHPFFKNFHRQTDEEFKHYLLQKTALSQNFVSWYDRAILGLQSEEAKDVLRSILKQETPEGKPSHREDLLADLASLGITKDQVLDIKPTQETLRAKQRLDALVGNINDSHYDLRCMTALRMAGEILVGVEYGYVVPALEQRFGLYNSRFYSEHYKHDAKKGASKDIDSHTDAFVEVLEKMITDEQTLVIAKQSVKTAYDARMSMFNQFTPKHKAGRVVRLVGRVAAGMMLTASLGQIPTQLTKQEQYNQFLRTAPIEMRLLHNETERFLLEKYHETHDSRYLRPVTAQEIYNCCSTIP